MTLAEIDPSKFELDNKIYTSFPDLQIFLQEAGIRSSKQIIKIIETLNKSQITDPMQLVSINSTAFKSYFSNNELSSTDFDLIQSHVLRLRRKGSIILNSDDLKLIEDTYHYFDYPVHSINQILHHPNGKFGLRSQALTEFYGPTNSGKTQSCMTIAAAFIENEEQKVLYIDTQDGFNLARFREIGLNRGIFPDTLDQGLLYARVDTFDELEQSINSIIVNIRTENIGMIIIDSIINPLKISFPTDFNMQASDFFNILAHRSQVLKKLLDQLKILSRIFNLFTLYTNQVRIDPQHDEDVKSIDRLDQSFNPFVYQPKYTPLGGNIMAHGTDIRISMIKVKENIYQLSIVDCGYLAEASAEFIIGKSGISN